MRLQHTLQHRMQLLPWIRCNISCYNIADAARLFMDTKRGYWTMSQTHDGIVRAVVRETNQTLLWSLLCASCLHIKSFLCRSHSATFFCSKMHYFFIFVPNRLKTNHVIWGSIKCCSLLCLCRWPDDWRLLSLRRSTWGLLRKAFQVSTTVIKKYPYQHTQYLCPLFYFHM